MNKMNKKGAEKLLSVWWFFVLAVVVGTIVLGVWIYYGVDINTKEIEVDVLAERIVSCLIDNSYLNQDFLDENYDIFEECSLDKGVFGKPSNFYFKISTSLREEIIEGDNSLEKDCGIEKIIEAKHFAKCSEKNVNFLYLENNEIKKGELKVLAGSNQLGERKTIV